MDSSATTWTVLEHISQPHHTRPQTLLFPQALVSPSVKALLLQQNLHEWTLNNRLLRRCKKQFGGALFWGGLPGCLSSKRGLIPALLLLPASPPKFHQGHTLLEAHASSGASMSSVLGSFAGPSTSYEHHCSPCARAGPLSGRPLVLTRPFSAGRQRFAERPQAVAAKAAPLTTEAPQTAKAASPKKQTELTPEVLTDHMCPNDPSLHGGFVSLSGV